MLFITVVTFLVLPNTTDRDYLNAISVFIKRGSSELSKGGHIRLMRALAEDGIVFRGQSFFGEDAGVIADSGNYMLGVEEAGLIGGEDEIEYHQVALCFCKGCMNKGLNINVLLAALGLFEH